MERARRQSLGKIKDQLAPRISEGQPITSWLVSAQQASWAGGCECINAQLGVPAKGISKDQLVLPGYCMSQPTSNCSVLSNPFSLWALQENAETRVIQRGAFSLVYALCSFYFCFLCVQAYRKFLTFKALSLFCPKYLSSQQSFVCIIDSLFAGLHFQQQQVIS